MSVPTAVTVSAVRESVVVTNNGSVTTVVTPPSTTSVTISVVGAQGPGGLLAPMAITQQIIAENYTLAAGYNGLSVEDVSVAATYTVTVPSGATWVII